MPRLARREGRTTCDCGTPAIAHRVSHAVWQRHQAALEARAAEELAVHNLDDDDHHTQARTVSNNIISTETIQPTSAAAWHDRTTHAGGLDVVGNGVDEALMLLSDGGSEDLAGENNNEENYGSEGDNICRDSEDESGCENDAASSYLDVHGYQGIAEGEWQSHLPASVAASLDTLAWMMRSGISERAIDNRPSSMLSGPHVTMRQVRQQLYRLLPPLRSHRLPCCINYCMAFNGAHSQQRQCMHCKSTRRAEFWHFSIKDRLLAEYAIPSIAQRRQQYVEQVLTQSNSNVLQDFWDGLIAQGMKIDKDTAYFGLSSDGVEVAGTSMWPVILFNFCDPPAARYRIASIPVVGFVPGNAVNISSFLEPVIKELNDLQLGVQAWHGYRKESFILRAQLVLVTADSPAMAKLTGLKGTNAFMHCRFCTITGTYEKALKHMYYSSFRGSTNTTALPPLRANLRQTIIDTLRTQDPSAMKQHGVASFSSLLRLPSLQWPESFPVDGMHLFMNVAKLLMDIWTQRYIKHPATSPFAMTSPQIEAMGLALAASAQYIPQSVCDRAPRHLNQRAHYKAVEWFAWAYNFSVPLMYAVGIHQQVLDNWLLFVEGFQLAMKIQLSAKEINRLEWCFRSFVAGYEDLYMRWGRTDQQLRCGTSQIHALLHVAHSIRHTGPAFVSWQFASERVMGTINPQASARRYVGTYVSNQIATRQNLFFAHHLYGTTAGSNPADHGDRPRQFLPGAMLEGLYRQPHLTSDQAQLVTAHLQAKSNSPVELQQWRTLSIDVVHGMARQFTICASMTHGSTRARSYIAYSSQAGTRYGLVTKILFDTTSTACLLLICPLSTWTSHDTGLHFPPVTSVTVDLLSAPSENPFPGVNHPLDPVVIDIENILGPIGLLQCPASTGHRHSLPEYFVVQTWRVEWNIGTE